MLSAMLMVATLDIRWNNIANAIDVNFFQTIIVGIVTFKVFDFFQCRTLCQHSVMLV